MLEFNPDIFKKSKSNIITQNFFLGSLPFTVSVCGEFFCGKKYYTKRDGLNNYLLFVTVEGTGKIIYKNQSCILKPGTALIIDCNILQEYYTFDCDLWHFYFIHLDAHSIEAYNNFLLKKLTSVTLKNPGYVFNLIDEIYNLSFSTDARTNIIISNIISNILTEMVCSLPDENGGESPFIREDISVLQEFIRDNFKNELSVDDFVKKTNLSRYYLIHTFKKQTGMSPYQYLHLCRINYARTLLTTTNMTISEIAESAGYNSAAVFIRHFKSFNKTTPQKLRSDFRMYLP